MAAADTKRTQVSAAKPGVKPQKPEETLRAMLVCAEERLRQKSLIARGRTGEEVASRDEQRRANTDISEISQEIREIKTALQRVADGTYGACSSCEKPISPARLLVRPHAKYCVPCTDRGGMAVAAD
jgi:RNA polymerase-binding transcription factor DksA